MARFTWAASAAAVAIAIYFSLAVPFARRIEGSPVLSAGKKASEGFTRTDIVRSGIFLPPESFTDKANPRRWVTWSVSIPTSHMLAETVVLALVAAVLGMLLHVGYVALPARKPVRRFAVALLLLIGPAGLWIITQRAIPQPEYEYELDPETARRRAELAELAAWIEMAEESRSTISFQPKPTTRPGWQPLFP